MLTPVEIKILEYFLFCEWSGSEAAVQHLRFSPETSGPAVRLFYTWNYPTGTSPWFLQTKLQFSSRVPQKVLGLWESSCGGNALGTGFLVFVISYNTNFSLCKEPAGCLEKLKKFCLWICNRKFSFLTSSVATDFLFSSKSAFYKKRIMLTQRIHVFISVSKICRETLKSVFAKVNMLCT